MSVPTTFLLCSSEVSGVCSCISVLRSRDLDSAYLCRHVSLKVFSRRPRIDSEMEYDNCGCVSESFGELEKFSTLSSITRHSGLVWNNQSGAPLS